MFKNVIACAVSVLVLAMCLMPVSVSAGPDDVVPFTLSVTEGGVGETVEVSLSLPENSRFANATMYLHYNPDAVSYVEESIEAGPASPKMGTMFEARDHKDLSYVKFAFITGGVVTKGGVLLTFDFEVLSASPAAFSLSFDECQGETEDEVIFDVKYEVVGCVLNNDGSVSDPTGGPVHTTATQTPAETTTATAAPVNTTTSTLPTMVVTDAQGSAVTVPVVEVTDAQGNVATIPVAEGTDAYGNNVTIPVAIVTDDQGNVQTVPVATATDAQGNIVTVPVTTSTTESAPDHSGLTTGIVIIVIGVVVAVVAAVAPTKLRKKNEE